MGANFSTLETVVERSSLQPNLILTFHSTAKWKAHFEASKETNKLPIIKELAAKYKDVEFIKIDVDELMDVASAFQVQAMPTFILIKKGKVVEKVVGAKKEQLQKLIEKRRN
ncbi:unnamed protein product [Trifolium pratense]|uniref:Uncharacterized protein n=1 Tax=Trifolium pratense TaxID=57577 RepID=A0ACB0JUC2_TRIPR|nr:unnamed protein product [Trifolium pratense]